MSFIDGFLDKMNLSGGYDDEDDEEYDDYESDDVKETPASRPVRKKAEKTIKTRDEEDAVPYKSEPKPARPQKQSFRGGSKSGGSNARVVNMRSGSMPMEVCVIRPNNVEEDAHEIADTLLTGRAIVINLEGLDMEIAQRIIDFTSGACCAIDGKLKKISNFIFIATPKTISISGDLVELMGGREVPFSSESDF